VLIAFQCFVWKGIGFRLDDTVTHDKL